MPAFTPLTPDQMTDAQRAFFRPTAAPGSLRFFALLAGTITGHIWTDDPAAPRWGILQERTFGTLYLQGDFPEGLLAEFITERQTYGEVLYGFWEVDDPYLAQMQPPAYRGFVLESAARSAAVEMTALMAQMPPDGTIRPVDAALFPRLQDYAFYSEMFGSAERALAQGFGYCLMRGEDILCEAFAGASARGLIELGVNTWQGHYRQGYASLTCAHVIHEAERRGLRTYWNCAMQNAASAALALRLGYAPMVDYRLWGWH